MLNQAQPSTLEPHFKKALAKNGPVLAVLHAALPEVLAVYVFGSRVQGGATADSDLDLAVLVPGYVDPLQLWDLVHTLADVVGCTVDLLDLRAASTVMQYQVLQQGLRIDAQALAADLFECYILSEKLALDAARAGVMADIAKEGRVYAG